MLRDFEKGTVVFTNSFEHQGLDYEFKYHKAKLGRYASHFLEIYLKNGGFPETIGTDRLTSKTILVDLYNDILSRDIVSRFDADLGIVKKIGYYLMTNIGALFSYNSVARALNLHYLDLSPFLHFGHFGKI